MKVAIIHDWLVVNGGAEKVLKSIIELFPDADIFSLVNFLNEDDRKEILKGKFVNTSFIQKLPFSRRNFRNYLPLFPKAIESFNLKNYNLIISSSWAVAKGIKKDKNQLHISYCHTPIRYAWDLYDEYLKNLKYPKKLIVKATLKYIRSWDISTLDRVDYFIANSNYVKERIKRIYNRESKVIYPPVDLKKFSCINKKENFYITVSRLVPYKKVSLIVEAFNEMPDRTLIIIGMGEEFEKLKRIAKNNIILLGYQPDNIVKEYLQKAKAFVYAANEDFGIAPVEAMACGTPVIALNKGGTAETVIDKITGILFQNQSKFDIIKAVNLLDKYKFDAKTIRSKVLKYDKENFKKLFLKYIRQKIEEYKL